MSHPVLQFEGVSRTFGSGGGLLRRKARTVAAVRNLDLAVARAEIFALVGESGAGKTTTGRLALGMLRPDTGRVLLDGISIWDLPVRKRRALRRRTHFILQDPYGSLHPAMTVEDIVAEPLAIAGVARRARREPVLAALDEVRLTPAQQFLGRYPHQLSGGQRQRVAFARALVGEPDLVVADEPVSMLDVSLQADILDLVFGLREQHGLTVIFVTHDLAVARHVADRIGVMHGGRLVEVGDADTVVDDPHHPYTRALLAAVEELAPPTPTAGPFPPGGQPCERFGLCDPQDASCCASEPILLEVGPAHFCACHPLDPEGSTRQGAAR